MPVKVTKLTVPLVAVKVTNSVPLLESTSAIFIALALLNTKLVFSLKYTDAGTVTVGA